MPILPVETCLGLPRTLLRRIVRTARWAVRVAVGVLKPTSLVKGQTMYMLTEVLPVILGAHVLEQVVELYAAPAKAMLALAGSRTAKLKAHTIRASSNVHMEVCGLLTSKRSRNPPC